MDVTQSVSVSEFSRTRCSIYENWSRNRSSSIIDQPRSYFYKLHEDSSRHVLRIQRNRRIRETKETLQAISVTIISIRTNLQLDVCASEFFIGEEFNRQRVTIWTCLIRCKYRRIEIGKEPDYQRLCNQRDYLPPTC